MKPVRPLIVLALGASLLVVVGPADAAAKKPKPVCNLIKSPPGDAAVLGVGDPNINTMDILSADIAADKKNVTAVIRVKKLATTAPTGAPTGMTWRFGFKLEDFTFGMAAHADPTGAVHYDASYSSPGINTLYGADLPGRLDFARNEIHITAPTSLFAAQATIKPGKELTNLTALTAGEVSVPDKTRKVAAGGTVFQSAPLGYNNAKGSDGYVVGTSSCVTPGK